MKFTLFDGDDDSAAGISLVAGEVLCLSVFDRSEIVRWVAT